MIEFKKSRIDDIWDAAIEAQWEPYTLTSEYRSLKKRNGRFVERLYLSIKRPYGWHQWTEYEPHLEITYYKSSTEWGLQRPIARFRVLLADSVMEPVH